MTTVYLLTTIFEDDLARSDQVLVPRAVWETFDRESGAQHPLYVSVGTNGDLVARLRPAVPSDGLGDDECRIPPWMATIVLDDGEAEWLAVTLCRSPLPTARTLMLRARREAVMTESLDPVAMLTAALSGADGQPSWACVCAGTELPLACGVFDILEIKATDGSSVAAACILDCDVEIDLVPALDHVSPICVSPSPEPVPVSGPLPVSGPSPVSGPLVPKSGTFVPFSGAGRRLCD